MISPALLVNTFTRQTLTKTSDSMGGWTESWTDGVTFKGRLSTLNEAERMAADKTTVYATFKLFADYMTITPEDRIKLGTRYFQIKGILNPSNINSHLEIIVLEID